jgi:8-amino-7-oxononanoate synthase
MHSADNILFEKLKHRQEQGMLRQLTLPDKKIDFTSNDYLGFTRSSRLIAMIEENIFQSEKRVGSGGSRLLSGNSKEAEALEIFLASVHNSGAALLFNSGYDANLGLFSAIAKKEDSILYDELVHASIHDGIRLSHGSTFPFQHNNLQHLEERLKTITGIKYVAVESVYSMDGDYAPLAEISELCERYNAALIVDEAHATGVFGIGLVQGLKLEKKVFARVHTFGKAMGCHGATIVGSEILKNYLINFARSFIYTTALPLHSIVSIECAYRLLSESKETLHNLHLNIGYFREKIKTSKSHQWLDSVSAIQSFIVPGNNEVRNLCKKIQDKEMDVRPILSPTVPKGKERIRVCLHSYNTRQEIDLLFEAIEHA